MSAPIIFPSLSRQPKYKSTRTLEDGTIKDSMESGYVATRPRFTRLRRTFGATYQNLALEDIRALDQFEQQTVQGQAGSFYYPNLLPNASFEFPGVGSQLFSGWNANTVNGDTTTISVGSGSGVEDGSASALFQSIAGATANPGSGNSLGAIASLTTAQGFAVRPGDTLTFTGWVSATLGDAPSGIGISTAPFFLWSPSGQDYPTGQGAATSGFVQLTAAATVPAGVTVANFGLLTFLTNSTNSPITLDGSIQIFWDNLALAVTATTTPYGRIPGSLPLASLVRLSKPIAIKDNTWAGGQSTYDATIEMTEV